MRVIIYSGAEPLALMSHTGAEHTSYTSTGPEKAYKAEEPTVTHDDPAGRKELMTESKVLVQSLSRFLQRQFTSSWKKLFLVALVPFYFCLLV